MNQLRTHNSDVKIEEMEPPFFSIIVPVYNVALYLRACLDSILAQTFANWECICVDDGSTDDSGAILDEYAARDARFHVIHQRNHGVSVARNRALDTMQGEWQWCVDGDDAIRLDALAWLYNALKQYPQVDSIAFNFCSGVDLMAVRWTDLPPITSLTPSIRATSSSLRTYRQAVYSTILRKSALRFEPYVIGEDALFQVTAYWSHRQRLIAEVELYFYREREGSVVHSEVSFQKVHDLLSTDLQILRCLLAHASQWCAKDMDEFLRWKRDFVWFTFQTWFYQLPSRETKQLIPLWCQVQAVQFTLRKENLWRRFVWSVIYRTQSPFACKILIFWPKVLQRCLRDVLDRLGLLERCQVLRSSFQRRG